MRRNFILQGDLTTAGGVVAEGLPVVNFDGRGAAFEGAPIDCPACKSRGLLKCVAPRRPYTLPNGRQIALENDLCLCRCHPPPKLKASQNFAGMDFTSDEWAGLSQGQAAAPAAVVPTGFAPSSHAAGAASNFSQALDFGDFPDAWLPWEPAGEIHAISGGPDRPTLAARLDRPPSADMTAAVVTAQAEPLRYWQWVGPEWVIEHEVEEPAEDEAGNGADSRPAALAERGMLRWLWAGNEPPPSDPYRVRPGDTLSGIAKRSGRSTAELQRLNGLADPRRLQAGQTLYLSHASARGLSVQFLDALRHPIASLPYRLSIDGHVTQGRTGADGTVAQQVVKDAGSALALSVQDVHGRWRHLVDTSAGVGHRFITLVSGALVFPGHTGPHPAGVSTAAPGTARPPRPALPSPQGEATKNNPAVRTRVAKGALGQPVLQVAVDLPQGLMDLFRLYSGEAITEKLWSDTAEGLKCETAVLKAIADVESKEAAFVLVNKAGGLWRPNILYERHYFSQLTSGRHDHDPDISWPKPFRSRSRLGHQDKDMPSGSVGEVDIYGSRSYLRLIKAYRLDADAALQSCSWGKFQVTGREYATCRMPTPAAFIELLCTSEVKQIEMLATFIRHKADGKLWKAVKAKDWDKIALYYNGAQYKIFSYHTKLRTAYEKHRAAQKKTAG